jgi:hypothetical protein
MKASDGHSRKNQMAGTQRRNNSWMFKAKGALAVLKEDKAIPQLVEQLKVQHRHGSYIAY